jgi:hypothetical protein
MELQARKQKLGLEGEGKDARAAPTTAGNVAAGKTWLQKTRGAAADAGSRRYRKRRRRSGAVLERYGADRTPSYHVTLDDGANRLSTRAGQRLAN